VPPNPILAGLDVPRSALRQGKHVSGFIGPKPACEVCGTTNYAFIPTTGDGPAVFVHLDLRFIVVGAALIPRDLYQPPFWVHVVL